MKVKREVEIEVARIWFKTVTDDAEHDALPYNVVFHGVIYEWKGFDFDGKGPGGTARYREVEERRLDGHAENFKNPVKVDREFFDGNLDYTEADIRRLKEKLTLVRSALKEHGSRLVQ